MSKVKVMLVDDHELVRAGLAVIIEKQTRFEIVAYAKNKAEALTAAKVHQPDIAIVDIRLKGESGIEVCEEIVKNFPRTKVLMLTSFGDEQLILKAIKAGASGYLLKKVSNNEILRGLNEVADGKCLFDAETTAKVITMMKNLEENKKQEFTRKKLTENEYKVLKLLCQGKTNQEIAEELHLSANTVKNYVSNILIKLEVSNRAEAAAFATKNKIEIE